MSKSDLNALRDAIKELEINIGASIADLEAHYGISISTIYVERIRVEKIEEQPCGVPRIKIEATI